MTRKSPISTVIKALFARSGNECAFPECTQRLVNEKNQFIGQLCHIESANPGGERHNEKQSDESRRSYENLILLCYPHHIETNDVQVFSVAELQKMKVRHEQKHQKESFEVSDTFVSQLISDMEKYWRQIEVLNTIDHVVPSLAMPINAKSTFFEIVSEIKGLVNDVEWIAEYLAESDESLMADLLKFLNENAIDSTNLQSVPYFKNPFIHRNLRRFPEIDHVCSPEIVHPS